MKNVLRMLSRYCTHLCTYWLGFCLYVRYDRSLMAAESSRSTHSAVCTTLKHSLRALYTLYV